MWKPHRRVFVKNEKAMLELELLCHNENDDAFPGEWTKKITDRSVPRSSTASATFFFYRAYNSMKMAKNGCFSLIWEYVPS